MIFPLLHSSFLSKSPCAGYCVAHPPHSGFRSKFFQLHNRPSSLKYNQTLPPNSSQSHQSHLPHRFRCLPFHSPPSISILRTPFRPPHPSPISSRSVHFTTHPSTTHLELLLHSSLNWLCHLGLFADIISSQLRSELIIRQSPHSPLLHSAPRPTHRLWPTLAVFSHIFSLLGHFISQSA